MIEKNFDLGQFVKTQLAQQTQHVNINNIVRQKGASALSSSVSKQAIGQSLKASDGVNMGWQLNGDFIPIIYGFVGMSNTQFDEGQKPSEVDAEKTVQQIRVPVSEGPIGGVSTTNDYITYYYFPYNTPSHYTLTGVVLDEKYVVDPVTKVPNYSDLKFRMTNGDGTGNYYQSGILEGTNPDTDEPIDSITDSTKQNRLNDLDDVNAGKGENYVLYWNSAESQWEAKSFNTLLNEAGATYDGGAGGSGGSGGDGGSGGHGGLGGSGSIGTGLKYTQWNPPPTHVETSGTVEVSTAITAPAELGTTVVGGKGAPLRNADQTTPYFSTTITSEVDEKIDDIKVTTFFPDGIFKEITTTTTSKDGTITLCGTERPVTNSGNLNCLTPSVEIAPDGQSSVTKTKVNGEITVHVVFTTTLCGREFILHEGSYDIAHLKRGGYKHTKTFTLAEMNAGSGSKSDGTQLIGSITGENNCNAESVEDFNFKNWTLNDYLQAYPDQIVTAASNINVYAWVTNKLSDEFTISTNCYLNAVTVCDPMSADNQYKTGETSTAPYELFSPTHRANWQGDTAEEETDGYGLDRSRCYSEQISGSFSSSKNPDPLLVYDAASQGGPGSDGSSGSTGTTGSAGSAGTQGSVTVPQLPAIPSVESANSIYSGDGTSSAFTLSAVSVQHADPLETLTLTITIPSGSGNLDVSTIVGSTSHIGRGSSSLTLGGVKSDLQATLDTGLIYTSSSSAIGDIDIDFYISGSGGNSREVYKIRTQAQLDPVAPTFTITVNDYNGTFDAYVRGKAIMNSITGSTSNSATATAIAQAITSYSSIPNWTATANSNVVTCVGPVSLGARYNDVQPTFNGTMDATMSVISGGVTPTRISRPTVDTTNVKSNFVKFGTYSNALNDVNVAWAELVYRPNEKDGTSTVSDIGLIIGGREGLQEPQEGVNGAFAMSFETWRDTYNFNHPRTAVPDGNNDPFNLTLTLNPASYFLDYATNTVYGLGNELKIDQLPAIHREQFYRDVWDAMAFCNAFRIQSSGIFYGAESKMEALNKIAAVFDGRLVYVNGYPRLLFEGKNYEFFIYTTTGDLVYQNQYIIKHVVNQTNSANVIYSGNSIDNIYNKVNVSYNDKTDQFKLKQATVELQKSSADYPFDYDREITLDYWGMPDEYMAHFKGKWFVETERVNSETITYIGGWDHFNVLPNDLISFNDTLTPSKTSVGGRVSYYDQTNNIFLLDRQIAPNTNLLYTDADGIVSVAYTINDTADTNIAVPFGNPPTVGGTWNTVDFSNPSDNLYRVIAIEESEDGIYAVTAQKHDLDKYLRIGQYAAQYL